MQTVKQIERFWAARQYDRLAREVLTARPEYSLRLLTELGRAVPAAALALIRMDELHQGNHPLNTKLIRMIIAAQEGDGGWGDPLTSALCLRALLCCNGQGVTVERGLDYLATLQKPGGIWPAIPVPRVAEDPFVSAYILFVLGDQRPFRAAVRLDQATDWFARHEPALDDDTRRLWLRAATRCRPHRLTPANSASN